MLGDGGHNIDLSAPGSRQPGSRPGLSAPGSRQPGSRLLQRAAAYVIAADLEPRFLYVPTEDMPADAPSRGVKGRPARRRVLKKRGFSKVDRRLHREVCRLQRQAAFL